MTMTRYSEPSWSESSTRILDPVSSCRCLIEDPDFPMKPPTDEWWQSRRREACPAGTTRGGGCGGLTRLAAAEAEGEREERKREGESDIRGSLEGGGERKTVPAIK